MKFNYYNLKDTKDARRIGFVYMGKSWHLPRNLDIFLGYNLFSFWGRGK